MNESNDGEAKSNPPDAPTAGELTVGLVASLAELSRALSRMTAALEASEEERRSLALELAHLRASADASGTPTVPEEIEVMRVTPSHPHPPKSDIGSQIGPYRPLSLIGSGGFASVYCAEDTRLVRLVALKVLHPNLSNDDLAVRLFREEGRVAARLRHPNIVAILDVGETDDGRPYVVMELLAGTPLSELIRRRIPLSHGQKVAILAQLASAVDYVHTQGLVHRDIKPSNVMIDASGDSTLMDFTVAVSQTSGGGGTIGSVAGTPGYMAPEQFSGQSVEPSADIYALGVLAFELFTGRRLFEGDVPSILQKQQEMRLPSPSDFDPDVPAAIATAIEHALARDPKGRPHSAAAFLAEAQQGTSHSAVGSPAMPPTADPRTGSGPPDAVRSTVAHRSANGPVTADPPGPTVMTAASDEASSAIAPPSPLARSGRQPERVRKETGGAIRRLLRRVRLGFTAPQRDPVDCTVFSPHIVKPGEVFLVQAFAHLPNRADAAEELALGFDPATQRLGFKALSIEIAHGTVLTFGLSMPGMEVDDPVQSLVWRGEPASVQFGVTVARLQATGSVIGTVIVSQHGIPMAHIKFKVVVDPTTQADTPRKLEPSGEVAHFYKKAFISYASPDRLEVLKRVQMLAELKIGFFQDVLHLDPGTRWDSELYRHIDESDLFLLFWSHYAKESDWVMKEVRYALNRKGGDDLAPPEILPVIIEGPPPVPPPPDLQHLHFNDRLLYFMAGSR